MSMSTASKSTALVAAWVATHSTILATADRLRGVRRRGEHGQASAEYAMVLLGCAAVALLITAWATKTDTVGKLLDKVMNSVSDKVKK